MTNIKKKAPNSLLSHLKSMSVQGDQVQPQCGKETKLQGLGDGKNRGQGIGPGSTSQRKKNSLKNKWGCLKLQAEPSPWLQGGQVASQPRSQ